MRIWRMAGPMALLLVAPAPLWAAEGGGVVDQRRPRDLDVGAVSAHARDPLVEGLSRPSRRDSRRGSRASRRRSIRLGKTGTRRDGCSTSTRDNWIRPGASPRTSSQQGREAGERLREEILVADPERTTKRCSREPAGTWLERRTICSSPCGGRPWTLLAESG